MKPQKTLAEKWLWLGVAALAVAGVFAVLLVVARTPQLKQLSIVQGLFDVALVVHVDLSVLMWFLCALGMGVAQLMQPHAARVGLWSRAALGTVAAATLLMALSPLDTPWLVIKSNYIPVLHNAMFLLSLGLLSAGLLALVLPVVITYASRARLATLSQMELGVAAAALCVLLALVAFFLSARALPTGLPLDAHYEILFWAGGHILQFAFALLMMAAWVALLDALGRAPLPRRLVVAAYLLAVVGAVISLAGFAIHPFDSSDFTYFFTRVMIELGGTGAAFLAVMVVARLLKKSYETRPHPEFSQGKIQTSPKGEVTPVAAIAANANVGDFVTKVPQPTSPLGEVETLSGVSGEGVFAGRAYASALIMSLILFVAGGVLGLLISGQNVGIPAHYHGQIVGITLALMGLAYAMLPRFGYASVAGNRLAFWQPIIYGVGQLMHIGGLAYSGGYGVLRKTAGGFEHLEPAVKAALGIMGLGGMIAIIGGILFVVVMLRVRHVVAK